MPIPASPIGGVTTASALCALFRQVHEQLREELRGLDDDAVNWVRAPGANSIATIVIHMLGSEAETGRCVAGVTSVRDRDAEFAATRTDVRALATLLDEADALLGSLEARIDEERLRSAVALPTLPPEELRPGVTWLIGNYGHAREHLGQVQLTKQLAAELGSGNHRGLEASTRNRDAWATKGPSS